MTNLDHTKPRLQTEGEMGKKPVKNGLQMKGMSLFNDYINFAP